MKGSIFLSHGKELLCMSSPISLSNFAYAEHLTKNGFFGSSSRYSEWSVSEQQIQVQQFGKGEFHVYTFSDSRGFIFTPLAAAPLYHTSPKGECPSVQAWHRNRSHCLLKCWMT